MTAPLLTPEQARKAAHDHAQRIVDDLDGRGYLNFDPTVAQEQKLIEAVEHDLRDALENLRLPEEDGA